MHCWIILSQLYLSGGCNPARPCKPSKGAILAVFQPVVTTGIIGYACYETWGRSSGIYQSTWTSCLSSKCIFPCHSLCKAAVEGLSTICFAENWQMIKFSPGIQHQHAMNPLVSEPTIPFILNTCSFASICELVRQFVLWHHLAKTNPVCQSFSVIEKLKIAFGWILFCGLGQPSQLLVVVHIKEEDNVAQRQSDFFLRPLVSS